MYILLNFATMRITNCFVYTGANTNLDLIIANIISANSENCTGELSQFTNEHE